METEPKNVLCPNCQQAVDGNFCSHCGTKLKTQPVADLKTYSEIISDKRCQGIIEKEAGKARMGMTVSEFLQLAQWVMPGRLPLSAMASLSGKVGETFNIGKEGFGFRVYHHPYSFTILAFLASLARRSMPVKKVMEAKGHCLIEAHIPSSIWHLEGRLETLLIADQGKTKVMMEAKIFGQWFDLGKIQQLIDEILQEMQKMSTSFTRNKELQKTTDTTATL